MDVRAINPATDKWLLNPKTQQIVGVQCGLNSSSLLGGPSGYRGDSLTTNVQTGTTYTLTDEDNGRVIAMNNASAITLTVPQYLKAGFNCTIIQLGTGQITPTASGTTINSYASTTKTAGQYAACTLLAISDDVFVLGGTLA